MASDLFLSNCMGIGNIVLLLLSNCIDLLGIIWYKIIVRNHFNNNCFDTIIILKMSKNVKE